MKRTFGHVYTAKYVDSLQIDVIDTSPVYSKHNFSILSLNNLFRNIPFCNSCKSKYFRSSSKHRQIFGGLWFAVSPFKFLVKCCLGFFPCFARLTFGTFGIAGRAGWFNNNGWTLVSSSYFFKESILICVLHFCPPENRISQCTGICRWTGRVFQLTHLFF